jgi:hypothetical protein
MTQHSLCGLDCSKSIMILVCVVCLELKSEKHSWLILVRIKVSGVVVAKEGFLHRIVAFGGFLLC